jgi:tRNA acetyltransferase TAN1
VENREFDMLISTGRGLEPRCMQVLRGIFSDFDDSFSSRKSGFSGLLMANTSDARASVEHIAITLEERPWYNDLIKRAVPIDRVVTHDPEDIIGAAESLSQMVTGGNETFRVRIRKRGAQVDRMNLIEKIADLFENPVNLVKPDFELRVEMLRKTAGVSLIKRGEIFPEL